MNHQVGNMYLHLTGGLRRLKSSRGRLFQDGGGPRILERFSPVDNSTRTRQPHMFLNKSHHMSEKVQKKTKNKKNKHAKLTTIRKCVE